MGTKIMKGGRRAAVKVTVVNAGGTFLLRVTPIAQSNDGKDPHSVTVALSAEESAAFRASLNGETGVESDALADFLSQ